jgi:hypothetical protein
MNSTADSEPASTRSVPLPAPNSSTSYASPDFDRVERIVEFWGHQETRSFGELLIALEEDKAAIWRVAHGDGGRM